MFISLKSIKGNITFYEFLGFIDFILINDLNAYKMSSEHDNNKILGATKFFWDNSDTKYNYRVTTKNIHQNLWRSRLK